MACCCCVVVGVEVPLRDKIQYMLFLLPLVYIIFVNVLHGSCAHHSTGLSMEESPLDTRSVVPPLLVLAVYALLMDCLLPACNCIVSSTRGQKGNRCVLKQALDVLPALCYAFTLLQKFALHVHASCGPRDTPSGRFTR